MILNLANFFRTSLTADPTEDILLSEEITMQRLYLDIERARFPERLLVEIDVPDALQNARVPGMLLQLLVENAIKYGVSRSARPVSVTIRAFAEPDTLHLIVDDEPLAIERLQVLCSNIPAVVLVGTATDGAAALRLVDVLTPDLPILDIAMPALDGLDVARTLDAAGNRPTIIYVTALTTLR